MATTEDILNQLLLLPSNERAQLAHKLLESLEPEDQDSERLWDEEIKSRLEAYDRGELQAVPGEEVLVRLRDKFPRTR